MKTLVLPIAGKSSRFPDMRPKFLLTHPSGKLMITEAVKGVSIEKFDKVVIVCLKEHEERYEFSSELIKEFNTVFSYAGIESKLKIVYLEKETLSQPETVYEGCKLAGVVDGGIYVKDCDNCFKMAESDFNVNFISVCNLGDFESINASNKSYVKIGNQNTITNIAEKQIISDKFCCGGYYFKNIDDYNTFYNKLKEFKDIYISHIIFAMILDKYNFFINESKDYTDWGTVEAWSKFKDGYSTLFIDIDGVLLENRAKHFKPKWGENEVILKKNTEYINKLFNSGKHYIILTTCRSAEFVNSITLDKQGVLYNEILTNLPHCKRILINDYSSTNGYPSAQAINLKRNSDTLKEML